MFLEEQDDITLDNMVIFHHNKRFCIYLLETKQLLSFDSFTPKKIQRYLVDELDAEDDNELLLQIDNAISQAEKIGHSASNQVTPSEIFKGNCASKDGTEMDYDFFIAHCFQRGSKGYYRCEICEQVIKITKDEKDFIDNGGTLPVSSYCTDCDSVFI